MNNKQWTPGSAIGPSVFGPNQGANTVSSASQADPLASERHNQFSDRKTFLVSKDACVVVTVFPGQLAPEVVSSFSRDRQQGSIGKLLHCHDGFTVFANSKSPVEPEFFESISPDELSGSHKCGLRIVATVALNDFERHGH